MPATWDCPLGRLPACLILLGLSYAAPSRLLAQSDSARVTYRTREIVFLDAGRARGLAVGDTVRIVSLDGAPLVPAIVVSTALQRSSARILVEGADITVGQLVRFSPHPPDDVAVRVDSTPRDTTAIIAQPSDEPAGVLAAPVSHRLRGGLSLEQYQSSTSTSSSLTTGATILAADMGASLGAGLEIATRGNARWRSGQSSSLTGAETFTGVINQAELRFRSPGSRWTIGLGRFLPAGTLALGYIDGAHVDVRIGAAQRFGIVGGLVPGIERLQFSTDTKRAGAYWAFSGERLDGAVMAAADWGGGQRRRTEVGGQAFMRLFGRTTASFYGEIDLPVSGTTQNTVQITTAYASLNTRLPFGFRAGVNAEVHQSFQTWNAELPIDTTIPQPGRLAGGGFTLGHDVLGFSVDLSGGSLKRAGDATGTSRGSLSAARGAFFLIVVGQHSALMDYGSVMARFLVPSRALPFTLSLGVGAAMTRAGGAGATAFWRYSVRPELSRFLGSGLYATLGGDFGTYEGQTSTFLHAGLSYRLR